MSIAAIIDPIVLDTVIGQIAMLFLASAGGDIAIARHAAHRAIAAHHPRNEEELALAAEIVGFANQALQALGQSSDRTLPDDKVARLCSRAVNLARAGHRGRRALDKLRRPVKPAAEEKPATATPRPAQELVALAQQAIEAASKGQGKAWIQDMKKRQMTERMAENGRKNAAMHAATVAAAPPPAG